MKTLHTRKSEIFIKILIISFAAFVLISLLSSCEKAEEIDPNLKDTPSVITYSVNFQKEQPKRVIARLINSTYHGDKLDQIILDTVMTAPGSFELVKTAGLYAFVSLEVYPIGHTDHLQLSIDYLDNGLTDIYRSNSCEAQEMSIPELLITLRK